jgi:hypothetical protein
MGAPVLNALLERACRDVEIGRRFFERQFSKGVRFRLPVREVREIRRYSFAPRAIELMLRLIIGSTFRW